MSRDTMSCDTTSHIDLTEPNQPNLNQYTKTKTKCLTATPEETLAFMIRHHFTGDSEVVAAEQNIAQQTFKTPTNKQPTELTNKITNEDRLEKVIKALEPLKAAGPDKVQNVLIQNAYKHIKTPLLRLYKQSHNTGYIPKPWRET